MGVMSAVMPTGFSASVADVKAVSGDMARAEAIDDGVAVYWDSVRILSQ